MHVLALILQQSAGPITKAVTVRKEIALTFDACQNRTPSGFDSKVFAVLSLKRAKATLFLGGRWAETHQTQCKAIAKNHNLEIGQHSYLHPHFRLLTEAQRAMI